MIEEKGANTAFFSTNCGLQIPLILSVYEGRAIFPQTCCPSPYHGYPSALGIEIPDNEKGNLNYLNQQIHEKLEENNMIGRMSSWPVPVARMFTEASAEYAKAWIEGEFTKKMSPLHLKHYYDEYSGIEYEMNLLEGYDNHYLFLFDYIDF